MFEMHAARGNTDLELVTALFEALTLDQKAGKTGLVGSQPKELTDLGLVGFD